jgi:quinol monooxygenase YgiN
MVDRVVAVTNIHGLAGRRDELRALMRTTEDTTRAEPGCRVYRFAATLEDPDEYVHVQEWESELHFREHQAADAFKAYQRGLFDLLARPSEMAIHRVSATTVPQPSAPLDPRSAD